MNSYNENLRATVVGSLQDQYLDQTALKSRQTAAMFTLYHAEGAVIKANEELTKAKHTMDFKGLVKQQAVYSSNIAVNLLASATQADTYIKKGVSNTAVCAANVQVAATAIVKLSGDIANIAGIVHAADLQTDIDNVAIYARNLMNETASFAEVASQVAMETSALTAEVASSTVLDKSKSTNNLMNNLFKIASADFDAIAQITAADNVTLAAASATEKLAEGAVEDISVDYLASRNAYISVNAELNLDLKVPEKEITDISFKVYFNNIKSAFANENLTGGELKPNMLKSTINQMAFPIEEYDLILVKNSKKLTFTIAEAENLRINRLDPNIYARITNVVIPPKVSDIVLKKIFSKKFDFLKMVTPSEIQSEIPSEIPSKERTYILCDSDGDQIAYGQTYVMFLLAVYNDIYKRDINDFDDFLSAPSKPFAITIKLDAVDAAVIQVTDIKGIEKSDEDKRDEEKFQQVQEGIAPHSVNYIHPGESKTRDYLHKLSFITYSDAIFSPEYRCILLPVSPAVAEGLLTSQALWTLIDQETKIENDFDSTTSSILEKQTELLQAKALNREAYAQQAIIDDIVAILESVFSNAVHKTYTKRLQAASAKQDLQELEDFFVDLINDLENLFNKEDGGSGAGIFFNVALAEQVPAGSYLTAVESEVIIVPEQSKSRRKKSKASDEMSVELYGSYIAYIGPATTDCFGSPLIVNNRYLPVILSMSTSAIDQPANYTNAISKMADTDFFIYNLTL